MRGAIVGPVTSNPTPAGAGSASPVPNLRDLGGVATADGGATRPGTLFRSGQLDGLTDDGVRHLAGLGVRTVVDLRTAHERAAGADRLPPSVRHIVADVLADHPQDAAATLAAALRDPGRAAALLRDGSLTQYMLGSYRDFATTASAHAAYRQLLEAAARGGPVLFHCTAGKDRTGWGANLLLWVAGVDEDTRMAEYLAVNPAVEAMFAHIYAAVAARGLDPELMRPLLQVQPAYLHAAHTAVREQFGGLEGYLRDGLGVGGDVVRGARAALRGH